MREAESTAGCVEEVRTTMDILLVDLEALDDGVGSDHERMSFTSVSKTALTLVNLQQESRGRELLEGHLGAEGGHADSRSPLSRRG